MAELGIPAKIIRIMFACPSDIQDELNIFFREVNDWNTNNSEEYGVALLPKHWSTHSHPRLSGRPQAVVNNQITDKADFLIAVIGNKLGSSTGVAESGTVEEILRFHDSGRPVKLYFSERESLTAAQARDEKLQEELARVADFRSKAQEMGLYSVYKDLTEFSKQISLHIMQEIRTLRDSGYITLPISASTSTTQSQNKGSSDSLRKLRHTVGSLQAEWRTEANSHMSSYDQGKRIMSRLMSAVTSHLPELIDEYGQTELSNIEKTLPTINSVKQARPVMGPDFHKEFWDTGTQAFQDLQTAIEALR